jgi:hypothetical protein
MHPDQLAIKEVYSKVLAHTDWQNKTISPDFRIMVWSKFKIDQTADLNAIKDKIERRFEILLPLVDMDMLIIHNL